MVEHIYHYLKLRQVLKQVNFHPHERVKPELIQNIPWGWSRLPDNAINKDLKSE